MRWPFGIGVQNLAILADIFEANGYLRTHTTFLHRNAIERVGSGHRLLGMRYHYKLGPIQELFQYRHKPTDIGFIKRCIDFIEHAKRAWAELEDSHDQGDCRQCFLTTAQERVG